jgi:sugar phosphate permease
MGRDRVQQLSMQRKRSLLFWIWLMMAVAYLDRVNITIAGPTISDALHLSPRMFGFVLSAFTLGYALMQIPGGYLADRFGARGILVAALVLWSIFTGATGVAWSAAAIIIIRILFGVGEGIENGAQFKLIGDNFDSRERSTANAAFLTALAIGPAVAAPLTTWLIGHVGWRSTFYVYAIIGMAVAGLLYRFLPQSTASTENPQAPNNTETGLTETNTERGSWSTALRMPAMWLLLAAYLFFNVAFWGYIGWMPTYLSKGRHIDLKHLGPIASIPYLCGFIGMVVMGRLGTKSAYRYRPLLICIGYLLAGAFLYVTFSAARVPACIAGLSAAAFFLYGGFGPFWATAIDRMPDSLRGSLSGFVNFGGQVGGFVAPLVVGELVERTHSFTPGFLFMIGALVLASIALAVVQFRRD